LSVRLFKPHRKQNQWQNSQTGWMSFMSFYVLLRLIEKTLKRHVLKNLYPLKRLIAYLIEWLIDWLIDWMIDWMIDWQLNK